MDRNDKIETTTTTNTNMTIDEQPRRLMMAAASQSSISFSKKRDDDAYRQIDDQTQHSPSKPTHYIQIYPMDEDEARLRPDGTRRMNGLLADRIADGGGMLCNDENGLCLGSRGNIDTSHRRASGIYTSITKLAGLLDSTVDGLGAAAAEEEVPLVTIYTDKSEFIVKEYSGRTVVFRVPAIKDTAGGDDTAAAAAAAAAADEIMEERV